MDKYDIIQQPCNFRYSEVPYIGVSPGRFYLQYLGAPTGAFTTDLHLHPHLYLPPSTTNASITSQAHNASARSKDRRRCQSMFPSPPPDPLID